MADTSSGYIPTLQFQPYVSPYTAQPVKEFQDFGEMLNKRYDENIAQYDKLDEAMHQIQVSDADQHLKEGLLSDTRNAIKGIVQNGDWENAKSPVREVARRFVNDSIITTAQTNFQKAQKLEDEARQAEMNGKPQIRFKDLTNFSTVDPETGQVRHLDPNGAYEDRLDYQKKMSDMFDNIHASGSGNKTNNMMRDPDTGQLYQVGSGNQWSGVTKDDIVHAANRNFGSYLSSSEGQQRLKVLTSKNSDNGLPLDTASAINVMKQELVNTGLNRVFSESSKEQFTKPDRYNKGLGSQPSGTLINDISYQKNQDFDDLIDAISKKSRIVKNPDYDPNKPQGAPGAIGPLGSGLFITSKEPMYAPVPDKMKDTYNNLYSVFSSSLGTKDKDKVNPKIAKYLNDIKDGKIQPNLLAYNDPKDINAANDFFKNGAYQSAEYLDPQTGEKLSWSQIQDKYKNSKGNNLTDSGSDNDIKDAKVTGQYSPDNPFYDMTGKDPNFAMAKKVTIGGHSFVMGASQQDRGSQDYQASHLAAEITSARRTGLPVKLSHDLMVVPGPGNEGYYLKQGDEAPRGKTDGTPLTIDEVLAITLGHNVTPQK